MRTITVEELKARLDSGETLNLIDVREPAENAEFNIGGENIALGKIQSMAVEEIEHLRGEEVICYCRSGNRSNMACLMLEHMGFTNTVNVVGGMMAWQAKYV